MVVKSELLSFSQRQRRVACGDWTSALWTLACSEGKQKDSQQDKAAQSSVRIGVKNQEASLGFSRNKDKKTYCE